MARAASAAAIESVLARVLGDRIPDMVVGDVNGTPGGLVTGALARFGHAAPPWASYGWLCTFERPWPLLRIDAMLASNALAWRGYRALDLAIGEHRMQQGIVARAGGRAAVTASAGR
jgi:endonuclease/exonuclease/phosphatase family metal-dependent hydrolase